MNLLKEPKAIIEAALMASLTSIFVIVFIYLPILSILVVFLPVPFLILAYRHGKRAMVFAYFVTTVILTALVGFINAMSLFFIFGPFVFVMGYLIRKKEHPYKAIGLGTMASVVTLFMFVQILDWVLGIEIINEILILSGQVVEQQQELFFNFNMEVPGQEEIMSYFALILPGIIVVQSLLVAFLNYYMSAALLKRVDRYVGGLPEFSRFRWPNNIVVGSFIIITSAFLFQWLGLVQGQLLITNVLLVFTFVFFLQGIATVSYFIKKSKVKKGIRMLILAFIIVILSPLMTIFAILGVFDSVMDLRKIRESSS